MKSLHKIFPPAILLLSALVLFHGCSKQDSGLPDHINVSESIDKLKSPDPNERTEAAANLGLAGSKSKPAIPHLLPLLKDPDPVVRRLAAYALGEIGPEASEALPQLRLMMRDENRDVVFQVAHSIRNIDPDAPLAP
jgi:HEAT repeat protein